MTQCPHSGMQVDGRCYWCCKLAALNGHRDRLSPEALLFVGIEPERHGDPDPGGWSSTSSCSHIEAKQAELDALLDTMPGYFALLRRILE